METKTCRETIDLLMDFLEGKLPPETQAALQQHFLDCPPCLAFVHSYQATPRIVREATQTQVPEEVERRLRDFIKMNQDQK